MDKNQGIGIALLFIVFVAYYTFTKPTAVELERVQFVQDSIAQAKVLEENTPSSQALTKTTTTELPDSIKRANLAQSFGSFGEAMIGNSQIVNIENNLINLAFAVYTSTSTATGTKYRYRLVGRGADSGTSNRQRRGGRRRGAAEPMDCRGAACAVGRRMVQE